MPLLATLHGWGGGRKQRGYGGWTGSRSGVVITPHSLVRSLICSNGDLFHDSSRCVCRMFFLFCPQQDGGAESGLFTLVQTTPAEKQTLIRRSLKANDKLGNGARKSHPCVTPDKANPLGAVTPPTPPYTDHEDTLTVPVVLPFWSFVCSRMHSAPPGGRSAEVPLLFVVPSWFLLPADSDHLDRYCCPSFGFESSIFCVARHRRGRL